MASEFDVDSNSNHVRLRNDEQKFEESSSLLADPVNVKKKKRDRRVKNSERGEKITQLDLHEPAERIIYNENARDKSKSKKNNRINNKNRYLIRKANNNSKEMYLSKQPNKESDNNYETLESDIEILDEVSFQGYTWEEEFDEAENDTYSQTLNGSDDSQDRFYVAYDDSDEELSIINEGRSNNEKQESDAISV